MKYGSGTRPGRWRHGFFHYDHRDHYLKYHGVSSEVETSANAVARTLLRERNCCCANATAVARLLLHSDVGTSAGVLIRKGYMQQQLRLR
jgi:hypothetical protein